jgi:hypothetical protein
MNLFIARLTENRDRVGVVAYAGRVEASKGLIHTYENRETLHHFINNLNYASWTDHGVGLFEAMRILQEGAEEYRQGIVIFLTDGNMNVNPWGERTNENAQQDVYAAVEAARQMNIPIHTIGLNFDGNLAAEYINEIAQATGGLAFETANAADIYEIIDAFFYAMITAPQIEEEEIFFETIEYEEENPAIITYEAQEAEQAKPTPMSVLTITEYEDVYNEAPAINTFAAAGSVMVMLLILAFLIIKIQRPKRVFTGKLLLDTVDLNTRKASPVKSRNLIEYGSRVTLAKLLGNESIPAMNAVILTPSPTAPSHLPQLQIKCKNPRVKITKDFMEQDISKGVNINTGTEITIEPEGEDIQIRVRYVMV